MPKFQKGQSGNPASKKPGTKNKRTLAREAGLMATTEELDRVLSPYLAGADGCPHSLVNDFHSPELTPRDRLTLCEKFMQYRFPKMQATKVSLSSEAIDNALSLRLASLALDKDAETEADDEASAAD